MPKIPTAFTPSHQCDQEGITATSLQKARKRMNSVCRVLGLVADEEIRAEVKASQSEVSKSNPSESLPPLHTLPCLFRAMTCGPRWNVSGEVSGGDRASQENPVPLQTLLLEACLRNTKSCPPEHPNATAVHSTLRTTFS